MKYAVIIFILALIFIFPQSIDFPDFEEMHIYHYKFCEEGEATLIPHRFFVPSWLSVEGRAWVVFSQIFNNSLEKMHFMPNNVEILDVFFQHKTANLILNLSAEILKYGGTYFEYRLIEMLLANASQIPKVDYLTILIEGHLRPLPEGTLMHKTKVY